MSTKQAVKPESQKPMTPAVGWINPMTRMDGTRVADNAYVFRAVQDLTLKAGETLAVFQTKGGGYVVKARTPKAPATK